MKRIGHLFESVAEFGALRRSAIAAAKGKRLSAPAAAFMVDLESECLRLERELLAQRWRPGPFRCFLIYDRKPRVISAAPFRDRVVHHAVSAAMEPCLEAYAVPASYACRKGKGNHAAVRRAREHCRGGGFFLRLDVRKYFPSVDHEVLERMLVRRFKDPRFLDLLRLIVRHGPPGSEPGRGMPIGNLTSQHFANLYLGRLDHFVKEELRVRRYLRYMDDMVFMMSDKAGLWRIYDAVRGFLADELRLSLNEKQTLLAPVTEGMPFLGMRIWPGVVRLSGASARRFRAKYRERWREYREHGIDEETLIRSAASLVGHVGHADTRRFTRSFFGRLQRGEGT